MVPDFKSQRGKKKKFFFLFFFSVLAFLLPSNIDCSVMMRSPPKTSNTPTIFATPIQHYASDSNIAESPQKIKEAFSFTNIAARKNKRKNDDISKSEIIDMFTSLREDQDLKFTAIISCVNEVKVSIDFMTQKYDEALKRLETLEVEKRASDSKIQFLEDRIEFLERSTRGTSIEIRNIPQSAKETKVDLRNIIIKTAETLCIPLDSSSAIKDVYRINSKSQHKPIIADFTTVFARDNFLSSFKRYNKEHQTDKLSTAVLSIGGPGRPVYLSENLTQRDRKLYFNARQFAKNHGYSFCWTTFGRIYLRKEEGSPQIRITSDSDLDNLG